jgi:short-subunit dehydrogenase/predicted nucleotidyltransferase
VGDRFPALGRRIRARPHRFAAATDDPFYEPLAALLGRSVGVEHELRAAFEEEPGVVVAVTHGSWAGDSRRPDSDIDVLVVGDLELRDLRRHLRPIGERAGRTLDLTVLNWSETWIASSARDRRLGHPSASARAGSTPPAQTSIIDVLMAKLALVTGATSGIGQAYAERLAADGYDLVAVGRDRDRLQRLVETLNAVTVTTMVVDLSTDDGVRAVSEVCASEPLDLLVNNAGVAHYMPIAELSASQASELVHVKVLAPTMLTRAAVPGMLQRQAGTIINIAGMLGFGGPTPLPPMRGRAIYTAALAHLIAFTQALHEELSPSGLSVQVCCPGVVATEFHARQGMDMSGVPRMSAQDVVIASLRGLELGEVVCTPGVEDTSLLDTVFAANVAAFGGQSPQLASRYNTGD